MGAEAVASGAASDLRRKIGFVLPRLLEASDGLLTHPLVRKLYPEYLFTSHCVIRASVPLMETAKARAEELAPADPVAASLAPYLEQHIPEELDHDEWHAKTRAQRERDNARDATLQIAGHKVLRVSDFRLTTDPAGILDDVRALLAAAA